MIKCALNPRLVTYKGRTRILAAKFGSTFILQNPETGVCTAVERSEITGDFEEDVDNLTESYNF